jgi:hypothetical protein
MTADAVAADPLFVALDAEQFTERHIAALAAGVTAAVRIPNFLTPDDCAALLQTANRLPTGDHDPARVSTPIVRFGPALNDYRRDDGTLDADRYWTAAEAALVAWHRARLRPDPVAVALARLGAAWRAAVVPATIGGRHVFGGTLREIDNGALVHYDDVNREYPSGVFDQQVTAQLAFNVWVEVPTVGGAMSVWRRRWEPGDEAHREAYGYANHVVDRVQSVTLAPRLGDALLFNPNNLHAVEPNPGHRRIAFAFFLGLTTTGALIAWS